MDRGALRKALALYLVADVSLRHLDLPDVVEASIRSGVTCVQLRAKDVSRDQVIEMAALLQAICSRANVSFIVNDHLETALAVGASGVHVGVGDASPEAIRQGAERGFIVGYSPETDEQIRSAGGRGVDYLGIGPVFGTVTKRDAGPAIGPQEFARRRALTSLPVVAIGGITADNAAGLRSADGIAVSSAILLEGDPAAAADALRRSRDRR